MANNEAEQQRERIMENENRLRELSDPIKYNIRIIGVPEKEERGVGRKFQNIITENVPNLRKEADIQLQETH